MGNTVRGADAGRRIKTCDSDLKGEHCLEPVGVGRYWRAVYIWRRLNHKSISLAKLFVHSKNPFRPDFRNYTIHYQYIYMLSLCFIN